MDIDMPVMDGIDATRLIQQHHPAIRIVLVSGSEFAERAFAFLDSIPVDDGSHRYLTKSRVPTELVDAILEVAQLPPDLG